MVYVNNVKALALHNTHTIAMLTCHSDMAIHETAEHIVIDNIHEVKKDIHSERLTEFLLEKKLLIMLGIADGSLVRDIIESMQEYHRLLIYEHSVEFFRYVIQHYDLSDVFKQQNVSVVIGSTIESWLSAHANAYSTSKLAIIKNPSSFNEEHYKKVESEIIDTLQLIDCNNATLLAFGKINIRNQIVNMHEVIHSLGVLRLRELYKNIPVIIVCAGPSLDKNIQQLIDIQHKAVIIAVDTVVKTLVKHNITPHFIVTLDPQDINYRKFSGVRRDKLKDTTLVYSATCCPRILKSYKGTKVVSAQEYSIYSYYKSCWEDKGSVSTGSMSVVHVAFKLALHIGAKHIAFIGLDLCFTNGNVHADGLSNDKVEDFSVYDELDIHGNTVQTMASFSSFRLILSKMVRVNSNVECYNATEGGLHTEGMEDVTLKEFIDTYCIKERYIPKIRHESKQERDLHQLHDMMLEHMTELCEIVRLCKVTVRLIRSNNIQKAKSKILELRRYESVIRMLLPYAHELKLMEEKYEDTAVYGIIYYSTLRKVASYTLSLLKRTSWIRQRE